jgi:hypothetical protein
VTIGMVIATKTGCDYLWLVHGPSRGALQSSDEFTLGYVLGDLPEPVPTVLQPRVLARDKVRHGDGRRRQRIPAPRRTARPMSDTAVA